MIRKSSRMLYENDWYGYPADLPDHCRLVAATLKDNGFGNPSVWGEKQGDVQGSTMCRYNIYYTYAEESAS